MATIRFENSYFLLFFLLIFSLGCGESDGRPSFYSPSDENVTSAPEPVTAICEYVVLDATPSAPNPYSGIEAAPLHNRIGFMRIRADTGQQPPRAVSAILYLFSGHTLGANEFLHLGKEMVEMSGGNVEVWLQERRYHFAEDNFAMELAEQERDPTIAQDYYFNGATIHGRKWQGFLSSTGSDSDMASEWGLDLEMTDIRQVLSLVPEEVRDATVFIGGHSRGAAFAQCYAAYRFADGHMGNDDLAGIVLLDGGKRDREFKREIGYRLSVESIRMGILPRFLTVSPLGPPYYKFIEILGMTAAEDFLDESNPEFGPDGYWPHRNLVDPLFRLLLRGRKIVLSNESILGVFLDMDFNAFDLLSADLGTLTGGSIEKINGRLMPTDPNAYYTWLGVGDNVTPQPRSDVQALARSFYEGPSNGLDHYFPVRVDFDMNVAWHNQYNTQGTWQEKYFDMRNYEVDAPVYGLATSLMNEENLYIDYIDSLGPVRGSTEPRSLENGFRMFHLPEWHHMDIVSVRREANIIYPDIIQWMNENSQDTVQLPVFE